MDSELQYILDRGLHLSEKWRNGEYHGTDWRWNDSLEAKLEDYFRQRLGVHTGVIDVDAVVIPVRVARGLLCESPQGFAEALAEYNSARTQLLNILERSGIRSSHQ